MARIRGKQGVELGQDLELDDVGHRTPHRRGTELRGLQAGDVELARDHAGGFPAIAEGAVDAFAGKPILERGQEDVEIGVGAAVEEKAPDDEPDGR